jgi:hypothetical protein
MKNARRVICNSQEIRRQGLGKDQSWSRDALMLTSLGLGAAAAPVFQLAGTPPIRLKYL